MLTDKTVDFAWAPALAEHPAMAVVPEDTVQRRSFTRAFTWCFAVVFILYNSQLEGPWATNDGTGRIAGANITNAAGFVINGLLTVGLVALAFPKWRSIVDALRKSPWLILLLALGVLSSLWSATPLYTLRRGVLLVLASFAGMYLGVTFTVAEQVRVLRIAAFLIIVACLISIPFPSVSYHLDGPVRGALKGVFFHKNSLGRYLAFAACLIYIGRRGARMNLLRILPLIVIAVLLVMARSATALMVTVAMAIMVKVTQILAPVRGRKSELGAIALWMCLFAGLLGAAAARELILPILERDATMTGRAPLWAAVLDAISMRPLLGYGLGGFFEYPFHHLEISSAIGWSAPHAHNGFLQLGLELGLVGFTLFLLLVFSCIRKTIRHMRQAPHDWYSAWPIVYLVFLILYNITEATLVHGHNLFWILFVGVWTSLVYNEQTDARPMAVGAYR